MVLAATSHRFSRAPDPPGLPTIRAWQAQGADALLEFLEWADLGSDRASW